MLRSIIVLLTCGVGFALTLASKRYNTSSGVEQAREPAENKCTPIVPFEPKILQPETLEPEKLAGELRRIDEHYQKTCRVPEMSRGGWPALKNLEIFKQCNDEWARARREAIEATRASFLVMY
ncbi:MAG TPA: hypothetical protein VF656_20720 [Pyrinomonadaceae bacterium]|jgi:hypothetical protein